MGGISKQQQPVSISAILLAAGESRRMGEAKQLLSWGRSTFVARAADTLLGTAVNEIIVVVGHQAETVIKALGARSVKIARNTEYFRGMSSSIVAGLKLVSPEAGAVMIALVDQPLLDSQTIDCLISGFANGNKGIAVPIYQGTRGHPVIFTRRYMADFMAISGDTGGRQIIRDNPGDVLEVEVATAGVVIDIDTPEDYQAHLD
jgi:molybdenum cofactor cytidylyltransferase